MLINSRISRILSVLTENHNKVIAFDIEIINDNLKYSSWLALLASTTFGFILTQSNNFLKHSSFALTLKQNGIVIVCLCLIFSIVASAFLQYKSIKMLSLMRQRQTGYFRQQVEISKKNVIKTFGNSVTNEEIGNDPLGDLNIFFLELNYMEFLYLSDKERIKYKAISDRIVKDSRTIPYFLFTQIGILVIAYIGLFILAAPFISEVN